MLQPEIVIEKGPPAIPTLETKREVLILSDNKTAQETLSKMLVSLGHKITRACNGFDGGILFCTRSYELAIIDLEVPQINVWELSRIFKERSPITPVIVVTGIHDDRHRERLNMNCVDAILPKPFKLDEMGKTVEALLNSGTKRRGMPLGEKKGTP